jgi:very-short-patch-repair endonuclease
MAPPERRLWNHLRAGQLATLRFRRQHPLGPYIADFYCHQAALVVEIDGSSHQGDQKDHDHRRDAWMVARDLRVMRIRAVDVRDNLQGVLSLIERTALARIRSRRNRGTPSDPSHPADEPGHLPRR